MGSHQTGKSGNLGGLNSRLEYFGLPETNSKAPAIGIEQRMSEKIKQGLLARSITNLHIQPNESTDNTVVRRL